MSRVDPNFFANALMGGLQTGINLGQSVDQSRFARERAAANDKQTQFGNTLALDAQAMRRQEIESIAAERAARVNERENERKATEQALKFLTADDATFQSNSQAFAEALKFAPAGLQNAVIDRHATLAERDNRKAKYESMKAQGAKFDEGAVNYFKDYGIFVPKEDKVKSDREKQDQEDAQDREALVVDAVRQGAIGWEELPTFSKISNTSLLHSILTQRATAMAKQQAAIAEQQAAVEKQTQENAGYELARASAVAAGVDPKKMGAMIDAKKAGFTLPEGAFGGESDSAARAGLNQRIQAAKTQYEMATSDLKPYADAVGADPITGEPTKGSVTGDDPTWLTMGMWNRQSDKDRALITEYQKKRQAVDVAKRNYEALVQQASQGGPIQTSQGDDIQLQIDAKAQQLKAQGVPPEQAIKMLEEFEASLSQTSSGGPMQR